MRGIVHKFKRDRVGKHERILRSSIPASSSQIQGNGFRNFVRPSNYRLRWRRFIKLVAKDESDS